MKYGMNDQRLMVANSAYVCNRFRPRWRSRFLFIPADEESPAVFASLGAGAGSKAAGMYSMKYMSKNNSDVFACRSVVKDAYEHITQHRSSAEDAGTELRNAMHLLQRLSNSNMEMDASQAASINLAYDSSMGSREMQYNSPWEHRKVAQIVADGVYDDVDFTNERREVDIEDNFLQPGGGADDDSDVCDEDDLAENVRLLQQYRGFSGDPDDDCGDPDDESEAEGDDDPTADLTADGDGDLIDERRPTRMVTRQQARILAQRDDATLDRAGGDASFVDLAMHFGERRAANTDTGTARHH